MNDMKDMVLVKTPRTDSARKPKSRSTRSRRPQMENADCNEPAAGRVEPRKLNFDENMAEEPENEPEEKDEDLYVPESDDEPRTPSTRGKDSRKSENVLEQHDEHMESEDNDIFAGSFARKKKMTPKRAPTSVRKPRKSPAKKSAAPAPACSGATDAKTLDEEMREDEIDIRKDEVMKLLDKIRENRLVGILPLDCNAMLYCIQSRLLVLCFHALCSLIDSLRKDRKYFLQILVQEDLLTVKDAYENLNFGDGAPSVPLMSCCILVRETYVIR